jgi:hypothetical protein
MNIFEKNLSCIASKNQVLAENLRNCVFSETSSFEFANAQSGDINLIYNGIELHSALNPQLEAVEELNKLQKKDKNTVIILIGIGLGYLFKRLFIGTESKIIIYEPNLEILRFTLEAVDFSSEFNEDRVFLTNTMPELTQTAAKCFGLNDTVYVSKLKSADILYPEEVAKVSDELPNMVTLVRSNFYCLFSKSYHWLYQSILNIPYFKTCCNISSLENRFKNKAAVIVSPGPSLDGAIVTIKQNRDKFIIFCVNVACKKLYENGIIPDFVVFIDNENLAHTVEGCDLTKTGLIVQSVVHNEIIKLNAGKKFVFYGDNELFSRWLSKIADFNIKNYLSKGTVSYCALFSAYISGCSPIILAGQDLAFTGGKFYSSGGIYGDMCKCEIEENTGNIKVTTLNESENTSKFEWKADYLRENPLKTVKGQDGSTLLTNDDYSNFIKYFEEFAHQTSLSGVELINSSTGGAQINGFKNEKFKDIVLRLPVLSFNLKEEIEKINIEYKEPVKENFDKIIENIEKIASDIEKYIPAMEKGLELSKTLARETGRHNKDYKKMGKLTNSVLEIFLTVDDNLFKKHEILLYAVFKEMIEMNAVIDKAEEQGNDIVLFNNIAKSASTLFETGKHRLMELKTILRNTTLTQN